MGGYVICVMPAPLEASETLMPNVMDMDEVRCLFETETRVRGNLCVRSLCGCLQQSLKYQLEG